MFSLESPYRGDSNEYTKYTIISIKKKFTLNYPKNMQLSDFFSKGLQNEFEAAMVNEPSVFEPLKFYCICMFASDFLTCYIKYIYYIYMYFCIRSSDMLYQISDVFHLPRNIA